MEEIYNRLNVHSYIFLMSCKLLFPEFQITAELLKAD
jgi:hypothetical protein